MSGMNGSKLADHFAGLIGRQSGRRYFTRRFASSRSSRQSANQTQHGFRVLLGEVIEGCVVWLLVGFHGGAPEQISVRHNRHCRNLDAELIDFVKRHEKLRHLI
jgi:hypothetical protein